MQLLIILAAFATYLFVAKAIFHHKFSWTELLIQGIATSLLLIFFYVVGYSSQTSDVKLVNSVVVEKKIRKETCDMYWSRSPDNFCTEQYTRRVKTGQTCSTVNDRRTCTDDYATEYRSVYPWEQKFYVNTESGQSYKIDRIDRQGAQTPPRYEEVQLGDPTTDEVGYSNPIKGAASSLLNPAVTEKTEIAYPSVRDYYKVQRVIYTATPVNAEFLREWNKQFDQINSALRKTGANVILHVTGNPKVWAEQLARGWDAHNINDVVIVIGVRGEEIEWLDVRSWSYSELVNITLRDKILDLKTIDREKINEIILTTVEEYYELQDIEKFEFLSDDIEMPLWAQIILGLIVLVISPIITFIFTKHNL